MRVAAVDCGTNSIKLLVTEIEGDGQHDLQRELRIVRLGQGVDRTGSFASEAVERTLAAADEYAEVIARHDVEAVRVCATSATRDAANGSVIRDGLAERFGAEVDVLSGEQEAALSYAGAARSLGHLPDPLLVVDIGGGSTELVLGTGGRVTQAGSADVGSVRLTERHLHGDPPTAGQVSAAQTDALAALRNLDVRIERASTVVGVSGTVVTVAAHALALASLDADALHAAHVSTPDARGACADLLSRTVADRRALPVMHEGRADVIGGGAVVLSAVLDLTGAQELVVSCTDLLDGIAWSLVPS